MVVQTKIQAYESPEGKMGTEYFEDKKNCK